MSARYDTKALAKRLTSPYKKDVGTPPSTTASALLFLPLDHDADDRPYYGSSRDVSGKNRHATKSTAGLGLGAGKWGRATTFDGVDGIVTVPHDALLNPTGAFTIALWAAVDDPGVDDAGYVVFKDSSFSLQIGYEARKRNVRGRVSVDGSWINVTSDDDAVEYGVFAHWALTYGAGYLKLWKNGIMIKSVAQSGNVTGAASEFRVGHGASSGTPVGHVSGSLSHVLYANTVVDPLDVMGSEHPWNITKFLSVFADAYWTDIERSLNDVRDMTPNDMKRGGLLTRAAAAWGVYRGAGESDQTLIFRWQGKTQAMLGGNDYDTIITRMARLLGTTADVIAANVKQNEDPTTGRPRPRYWNFTVTTGLLNEAGLTAAQLEDIVSNFDSAGFRFEVIVQGTAAWDTATWDADDTTWSS